MDNNQLNDNLETGRLAKRLHDEYEASQNRVMSAAEKQLPNPKDDTPYLRRKRAEEAANALTTEPSDEYLGKYFGPKSIGFEANKMSLKQPEKYAMLRVFAVRRGLLFS